MLSPLLMLLIGRQLFLVTRRPLCLIPIIALQLDTTWAWLLQDYHQTVKDAKRKINSIPILIVTTNLVLLPIWFLFPKFASNQNGRTKMAAKNQNGRPSSVILPSSISTSISHHLTSVHSV